MTETNLALEQEQDPNKKPAQCYLFRFTDQHAHQHLRSSRKGVLFLDKEGGLLFQAVLKKWTPLWLSIRRILITGVRKKLKEEKKSKGEIKQILHRLFSAPGRNNIAKLVVRGDIPEANIEIHVYQSLFLELLGKEGTQVAEFTLAEFRHEPTEVLLKKVIN